MLKALWASIGVLSTGCAPLAEWFVLEPYVVSLEESQGKLGWAMARLLIVRELLGCI